MARPVVKNASARNFLYGVRYRIGEFSLRAFVALVPWIPCAILERSTIFLAWVGFGILRHYRRRMANNIAMALGDVFKTPFERRALLWRAWKNFARGLLDTAIILYLPQSRIIDFVAIDGEEHLRDALAKGNGVLALSAHLGGFTLLGGRLAASGYPVSVIVKHPRDDRFRRLLDSYRAQVGIATIPAKPRREAARGIMKALRENRIVLIIADEFKSGGVIVDFFGLRAAAPRGPATLALRTGAAVLPMFVTRPHNGTLLLRIRPEIPVARETEIEASVLATTQVFTRCLEEAIRSYPDQWNWLGFPRDSARVLSQMAAAANSAAERN